jgi:uncharacterized protein YjbJ (UPF0337 family)
MNQSTQDEAKGTFHEVKGTVKAKVGQATNNAGLEVEGIIEKIAGTIQEKIGQIEKLVEKPRA